MALLNVLQYPDKRLRLKAANVLVVDANIQKIVDDMFETMYAENGVGLAATQANIQQRIVVIDISEDKKSPLCVINPEIIACEGTQYEVEGCISFPGMFDKVERAEKVRLRALDRDGKSYEIDAEGLLSVCIQHEVDHLDGILFMDHLSRLKQDRMAKKIEKERARAME
ncbi:MAG: peptide deformylase [Gammaproteobacteria bacterium]|nr:peptide deformylase [Gammaproteobacteria bacterium]